MTNCILNQPVEDRGFEVNVFHADVVELGQFQECLLFELPVEYREPNDRHTCENHVECSVECSIVDESAREER